MLDVVAVAQACASEVHPQTMMRVIAVESSGNPHAIGVVDGQLEWQPHSRGEAIATARMLERQGFNYSVGLGQVNKKNFAKYGVTLEQAFDPCTNLRVASAILKDCFLRAKAGKTTKQDVQRALRNAFSCYYSGNFTTGHRLGYVKKVVTAIPVARPQTPERIGNQAVELSLLQKPHI
jgi:type IV secretion system protein VirB1